MKLTANFSQTSPAVFDSFLELAKSENWSNERFSAAINNALRSRHYPSVTVADLMDYDRRRKVYTYAQMCELVNTGIKAFEIYEQTTIDGKVYWLGEEY